MNEELIMNLAENIIGVTFFSLICGLLIGWYTTFTHYRQKEQAHKAVEEYKREQRLKFPPETYEQLQRKALSEIQRFCDSYIVTDEDEIWVYNNKKE